METPGDLVSFVHEEYHKYKEIRTRLPSRKTEEMHTTHLQLMQLLQLAITSLTFLFAALIDVDNTSRDSGPPGYGKTTCGG